MNSANLSSHDVSAQIARLFVYPVKSCAGIEVREALLTDTGLEFDRAWMVVDAQGVFMTQRKHPRLALVRPHLTSNELVLNAYGMQDLHIAFDLMKQPVSVQLWEDQVPALDMGDEAAQWFTDFLAVSEAAKRESPTYRLVRFDPAYQRASNLNWTEGVRALNQFNDGFPLLVLSAASLAELNERLMAAGHADVSIERFRPNIVLSGLQAHDEDRLSVMRLNVDGAQVLLKPVKPCPRCPIPNIDPATAQISPQVGDILQDYRQDARMDGAVTFGMNAIALTGIGLTLRVGQAVSADFDFV